jgi:hypothetical protein
MKERFTLNDLFSHGDIYAIKLRKIIEGSIQYDWALSLWVGNWWEDSTSSNHRAGKMIRSGWEPVEFVRLTGNEQ